MSTPWFEQLADKQSVQERDEFVKGMYGLNTGQYQHGKLLLGLLAGYAFGKYAFGSKKSRNDKR